LVKADIVSSIALVNARQLIINSVCQEIFVEDRKIPLCLKGIFNKVGIAKQTTQTREILTRPLVCVNKIMG